MEASGCYLAPAYTKESPEVQAAVDTMNKYLQTKITYDFSPKTEVVDKTMISQWLTVDDKMQVTFNTEKINKYIAQLAQSTIRSARQGHLYQVVETRFR